MTGTITVVGMVRNGTSAAGNEWQSQIFVMEEDAERSPMSVAFDVWNKKFVFNKGEKCTVFLEIKANEGKDSRWFNSIQVYKKEGGNAVAATIQEPSPEMTQAPLPIIPPTDENDTPF